MEKTIRWGIIGSGGIARRRTIPEGFARARHAKLTAVYDVNLAVNEEVASLFNARAADGVSDLLDSDVDAVYVASPANKHFEHVIACAEKHKHVLCEKPLGMNVKEAEEMVRICDQYRVTLGMGLMMRFLSQHRAAAMLIRDGRLGKPVYGRAQLSCWYPPIHGAWRQDPETGGGGSLMDMGSHCIDLLEMFFGPAKSVSCFINNNIHPYKSEDSAVVSLLFENGAIGTVDTYFCIPDNSSKNMLELYGSGGSILARGTIGQGSSGEMKAFLEDKGSGYDALQDRNTEEGISIDPDPVNTYLAEVEEFSLALLEGREPANNYMPGLRSQKVLEACYTSAKTGKVVTIG